VGPAGAQEEGTPGDTSPDTTQPTVVVEVPPTPSPDGVPPASTSPASIPPGLDPTKASDLEGLTEGYEELIDGELALLRQWQEIQVQLTLLGEEITRLDGEIGRVQGELAVAQQAVVDSEAALADTERELAETSAALAIEQQRLRDQAVAAYIGGGESYQTSEAILRVDSANDAATTKVYANSVVEDRRRTIERFQELQALEAELKAQADRDRQAAVAARDEVAGREAALVAARQDKADAQVQAEQASVQLQLLLVQANATRADYERKIAELNQVSDSMAIVLAERQQGQQQLPVTTAIFGWPLASIEIASPFGPRLHPVYNVVRMHNGADLDGAMGEEIFAVADGEVLFAEERGGYGNTVVIDHGFGLGTLYAHQSELLVSAGDRVVRGQVIGRVGSTGVSTGPHLHFEVRVFGQPVNPMPYLSPTR
jgi:murein DD-endopeptidase MepM/ murein hydrolase activator NlpD|nr:peptidoglycan DD-metalloendopeptidase family protein [Acidimicrobiales bacterium]